MQTPRQRMIRLATAAQAPGPQASVPMNGPQAISDVLRGSWGGSTLLSTGKPTYPDRGGLGAAGWVGWFSASRRQSPTALWAGTFLYLMLWFPCLRKNMLNLPWSGGAGLHPAAGFESSTLTVTVATRPPPQSTGDTGCELPDGGDDK